MPDINYNEHFRDLFENTSDLVYFLEIDGTIHLANPAWLNMLHYELSEVIGRSMYEFIHPDYLLPYQQCRADAIKNNKLKECDIAFVTRENTLVFGEGQVGCSYKNGRPAYTRSVFKNVTLKKKAEREIAESEKRLKAFFESGPDAVIVIDEFQKIIEWNSKAETIFGFTKKEISGKTLTETIIPPQYRDAHTKGMRHFLTTGQGPILNKTVEITALHKSGREFYISLSISNVKVNGRWLFIAFLSDISERKRIEESLIRKEAELMQSKMLEEKKDQFISIASHELKTPITTVKAYTQIALVKCKDCGDDVVMYLNKVDQSINKLTFLLNELLDVSKIHQGKLDLVHSDADMDIYLPEVLSSIQHIINDHKIILEKNAKAKIKIDRIRMEQVIINLVSNAAKYSPGENVIIVRSVIQNGYIIISVTDYGIGILQKDIEKIFDRFYRVEEFSNRFSGLGIGLFVSSEIIKQHGGKIWAESTEGKGSTFYFKLPVIPA